MKKMSIGKIDSREAQIQKLQGRLEQEANTSLQMHGSDPVAGAARLSRELDQRIGRFTQGDVFSPGVSLSAAEIEALRSSAETIFLGGLRQLSEIGAVEAAQVKAAETWISYGLMRAPRPEQRADLLDGVFADRAQRVLVAGRSSFVGAEIMSGLSEAAAKKLGFLIEGYGPEGSLGAAALAAVEKSGGQGSEVPVAHLIFDAAQIDPDRLSPNLNLDRYRATQKLVFFDSTSGPLSSFGTQRQAAEADYGRTISDAPTGAIVGLGDDASVRALVTQLRAWNPVVVIDDRSGYTRDPETHRPSDLSAWALDKIRRTKEGRPLFEHDGVAYDAWKLYGGEQLPPPAAAEARLLLETGLGELIREDSSNVVNSVKILETTSPQVSAEAAAFLASKPSRSAPALEPAVKKAALEAIGVRAEADGGRFKLVVPAGFNLRVGGGLQSLSTQDRWSSAGAALDAAWDAVGQARSVFRAIGDERSYWVWNREDQHWSTIRGHRPEEIDAAAAAHAAKEAARADFMKELKAGGPYFHWVDMGDGKHDQVMRLSLVTAPHPGDNVLRVPKGVHIEAYQEMFEIGKGNDQVFTFYRTEPPEDVEKLQRLTLPKMPE
ncbi:MAG: hypothetical protein IT384_29130 [Deltaproteobacteria bacterium]|nr:hypothetical protein [Deltaproteobacteria bacterium]